MSRVWQTEGEYETTIEIYKDGDFYDQPIKIHYRFTSGMPKTKWDPAVPATVEFLKVEPEWVKIPLNIRDQIMDEIEYREGSYYGGE